MAASCRKLRRLSMHYGITDVGLTELTTHCNQLESITPWKCYGVTNIGMNAVAEHCKSLTSISIWNCPRVSNPVLRTLVNKCVKLVYISVKGSYDHPVKYKAPQMPAPGHRHRRIPIVTPPVTSTTAPATTTKHINDTTHPNYTIRETRATIVTKHTHIQNNNNSNTDYICGLLLVQAGVMAAMTTAVNIISPTKYATATATPTVTAITYFRSRCGDRA